MVHRALLGSIERFFGVLIEHYGGKFPLWLAPEQIRVLPITDEQLAYADGLAAQLRAQDFRVTVDRRSERVGAKIRVARNDRVPYMLIVGPEEQAAGTAVLRGRDEEQSGLTPDAIVGRLQEELKTQD
jgi:threonyl-tRNA synthetase